MDSTCCFKKVSFLYSSSSLVKASYATSETFESMMMCLFSGSFTITSGRIKTPSSFLVLTWVSYSCPFTNPERSRTLSKIISPQFPCFLESDFKARVRLFASSLILEFKSYNFLSSAFRSV